MLDLQDFPGLNGLNITDFRSLAKGKFPDVVCVFHQFHDDVQNLKRNVLHKLQERKD